jgi:hypothetical protein
MATRAGIGGGLAGVGAASAGKPAQSPAAGSSSNPSTGAPPPTGGRAAASGTGSTPPPVTAGTGAPPAAGTTSPVPTGVCGAAMERIRITEVDLGSMVVSNEDEATLKPIVIAPKTTSGSRVAWNGNDGMIHVAELDASDHVQGAAVAIAGNDFAALHADDAGGVLLMTRPAHGAGDKHCGTLTNLCGSTASLPAQYACFDMYLVRFDGASETWATQLSQSSDARPAYLTSPTDPQRVVYIWQAYAHHGRIAFDGMNYAGYYGAAISVSQACVNADSALPTAVNIHQGDEMRVVGPTGMLLTGHNSFDWGCSHSGFERIVWDGPAKKFVTVCKTDNNNRIAFAPNIVTILPVDLAYADLGNVVTAPAGGYWLTVSNAQSGQPAGMRGLADVLLIHFSTGMPDKTVNLAADPARNERAPHIAAYGPGRLLTAWESSTTPGDLTRADRNRKFDLQVVDATTGAAEGGPLELTFTGNRYQDLVAFPDGSVAFVAPGSSATKISILRVLPCGG